MSNSENETLKADPASIAELVAYLKRIEDKIDKLENKVDSQSEIFNAQFEAIRTGTVSNNVAFDRLQSTVLSMRANLTELTEEFRSSRKTLV